MDDKMVDIDASSKTYDIMQKTFDRNSAKPLAGFRMHLGHLIDT